MKLVLLLLASVSADFTPQEARAWHDDVRNSASIGKQQAWELMQFAEAEGNQAAYDICYQAFLHFNHSLSHSTIARPYIEQYEAAAEVDAQAAWNWWFGPHTGIFGETNAEIVLAHLRIADDSNNAGWETLNIGIMIF